MSAWISHSASPPEDGEANIPIGRPVGNTYGQVFVAGDVGRERGRRVRAALLPLLAAVALVPAFGQDKKGKPVGKRYYALQFTRSVAAMPKFMEYDLEQISTCGYPLLVASTLLREQGVSFPGHQDLEDQHRS